CTWRKRRRGRFRFRRLWCGCWASRSSSPSCWGYSPGSCLTSSPMRSLSRAGLLLISAVVLVVAVATPAQAAELAANDVVLVREGVVVPDDLYAAGLSVRISGEVRGDLIATAAEELVIDGLVTGSVTAVAGSVTINGTVEGSVRVIANRLTVNGTIGRDLVLSVVTTRLEPGSHIGGEVVG